MMKKLARCIITLLIFTVVIPILSSCDNKNAPPEETDSTDDEITREIREIGENIHYSSQCIWGDLFVGIKYVYSQGLDEQNIIIFNLETGGKELLLEFDPLSYRVDPPAVEGNLLVWSQADVSGKQPDEIRLDTLNYDIFVYDMDTGETRQITDDEYVQRGALVSGEWVIWLDSRHGTGERYPYPPPFDVYAYDLNTGKEKRLTSATSAEGYDHLAISDNLVVWSDNRFGDPEVKSRPGEGTTFTLVLPVRRPANEG